MLCEDGSGVQFIRELDRNGRILNLVRGGTREFAGSCFSPDGRVMFFNVQGSSSRGGKRGKRHLRPLGTMGGSAVIRSHLHRIIRIGAVLLVGAAPGPDRRLWRRFHLDPGRAGASAAAPERPEPDHHGRDRPTPSDTWRARPSGFRVTFSEAVTVSGTPLLKLGIGEHHRDAVWDDDDGYGSWESGSPVRATPADIENLRCIFPEVG